MASVKDKSVVLLGETHINPEHHRWQLQMLATLYAARPDMVIGFEMFPRRVQKILDQWVAGELTESEFYPDPNGSRSGVPMRVYICLCFISHG